MGLSMMDQIPEARAELISLIYEKIARELSSKSGKMLSSVVTSYERVGLADETFLEAMIDAIKSQAARLEPYHLSLILTSLYRMGYTEVRELTAHCIASFSLKPQEKGSTSLVRLLNMAVVTEIDILPTRLNELIALIVLQLSHMSCFEISHALHFAKVFVPLEDTSLALLSEAASARLLEALGYGLTWPIAQRLLEFYSSTHTCPPSLLNKLAKNLCNIEIKSVKSVTRTVAVLKILGELRTKDETFTELVKKALLCAKKFGVRDALPVLESLVPEFSAE